MAITATEYGKNSFYNTVAPDNNPLTAYVITKLTQSQIDYTVTIAGKQYTLSATGTFDLNNFLVAPKNAADISTNTAFLNAARFNTLNLYADGVLRENKVFTPAINGFDFMDLDTSLAANNRVYAGHNVIYSSSGPSATHYDIVYGYSGRVTYYENHSLISGSDLIYGGSGGIDTVVLPSKFSNFTVRSANNLYDDASGKNTSSGFIVTDATKTVNTVQAVNVERLKFTDTNLALDIGPSENAGSVYMLYKAAFNRAPDAGGMGYWLAQKDNGSNIVTNIAQGFVASKEFTDKYGTNPTNASYVDKLYLNVLGRSGEAGGVAYWNQELDAGRISKAAVLVQFATLAEGAQLVAPLIANGIAYTEWVG